MINLLLMNGYGLFVWSAFAFTLANFFTLYMIINRQFIKENKKFELKFKHLEKYFSCKSENDLLAEFFYLISNLYSSQNEFEKFPEAYPKNNLNLFSNCVVRNISGNNIKACLLSSINFLILSK